MSLILVVILTVLVHLAFAGARVTLSLFALHLQASPFTVGALISLLALLPMLFSVYAGRVIDRVGVRKPMAIGAGAVMTGLLLGWAFPRLETLFAVSALTGSGFMLFHIAANHAAGALGLPEQRAKNFSLLALGFSTSGFLGPIVAGFAIDAIGHRHTLLLLSSTAILTFGVVIASRLDVPTAPAADKHAGRRRLTDLLAIPELRRILVVSALLSMAWDLFTFVTPIYGSRIGLSASAIGIILGAYGAAIFVVRLLLPLVVHRVSEWKLLIGGLFATGVLLAMFPLVENMTLLAILAFLLGAGLGGTQPMIMALLYNRAPAGRGGEAVGVRTLLLNFSQAGIPLAFGALGAALGMTPVFWTMAATLLAGGYYARRR